MRNYIASLRIVGSPVQRIIAVWAEDKSGAEQIVASMFNVESGYDIQVAALPALITNPVVILDVDIVDFEA